MSNSTTILTSIKATGYTETSTSPIGSPRVIEPLWTLETDVVYGHPIRVFDIPQVVNLTYPVSSYQGRIVMNNYPVNRTDFRLIRGVNNAILFFVRDIDKKPISMIGNQLTINIVDITTDVLLMQRQLTAVDPAKGLYNFTTLPAEMDTWPTGPVRWSISVTNNIGTMMLWTDQNYSPYSVLYVTDGPIPRSVYTTNLTWSDFTPLTIGPNAVYYSPALTAAAHDGYTDGMQTYVFNMTAFAGDINIDGSLEADPTIGAWFQIFSRTYGGNLDQDVVNIQGNYKWTRINVANITSGSINQVQYKS